MQARDQPVREQENQDCPAVSVLIFSGMFLG